MRLAPSTPGRHGWGVVRVVRGAFGVVDPGRSLAIVSDDQDLQGVVDMDTRLTA